MSILSALNVQLPFGMVQLGDALLMLVIPQFVCALENHSSHS